VKKKKRKNTLYSKNSSRQKRGEKKSRFHPTKRKGESMEGPGSEKKKASQRKKNASFSTQKGNHEKA